MKYPKSGRPTTDVQLKRHQYKLSSLVAPNLNLGETSRLVPILICFSEHDFGAMCFSDCTVRIFHWFDPRWCHWNFSLT
jgi:hypothetical protein